MKINKRGLLNILLLSSTLLYFISAIRNEIIPFKYQLIGFFIVILLFWLGSRSKKGYIKIILSFIVIILSIVHIKAQNYIGLMFVNDGEDYKVKTATISMISLAEVEENNEFFKDARYATSRELDLDFHEYIYNDISKEFNIVPNIKNTNYNVDMANALYHNEVDIIILDESQRQKLLEDFPSFNETTKVLKTFEKKIIIESNAIKVNPKEESFIMLLTANDTWGDLDKESLADVNILAIVNPKIEQIQLLSIPRDTYVPLACANGELDKLTHTGIYGIDCQLNTISDFIDLDINYYVKVNFSTLVNIIIILGNNVNIYNPYAFQGHTSEYYFEEGCLSLDAVATLNYARTRYELPNGDFGRQENQKRVLNSLMKKMTKPENIMNFGTLFNEISKQIDTNMDVRFVNQFVNHQLDKMPNWKLNSLSLPGWDGMEETHSFPGELLYVYQTDETQIKQISESVKQFMKAEKIEDIETLNPEETLKNNLVPLNPQSISHFKNLSITENYLLQANNSQSPVINLNNSKEIYIPYIDDSIQKFGIQIKPFYLDGQENFTKIEYIEACEATFGN